MKDVCLARCTWLNIVHMSLETEREAFTEITDDLNVLVSSLITVTHAKPM